MRVFNVCTLRGAILHSYIHTYIQSFIAAQRAATCLPPYCWYCDPACPVSHYMSTCPNTFCILMSLTPCDMMTNSVLLETFRNELSVRSFYAACGCAVLIDVPVYPKAFGMSSITNLCATQLLGLSNCCSVEYTMSYIYHSLAAFMDR